MDNAIEKELHDLIIQTSVKDRINEILRLDTTNSVEYIHEDRYINGIIADFTIRSNNEICSIVEVKGGNIGVTDYVRGIGQTFQYEYFWEEKIKYERYSENYKTMLILHSNAINNNAFNIARFKYPTSLILLEINGVNKAVREITKSELETLSNVEDNNLVTISQYYFRDNRIFEYYILMQHLLYLQMQGYESISRKDTEKFLMKTNTINNGNWRNVFITLSSLGLINSKNLLTDAGKKLATGSYEECAVNMYKSYISVYADEIIACFNENGEFDMNNQELSNKINNKFNNREVLFLTQSKGRYISSWLNILRDDYGIIDFKPRTNQKSLIYTPSIYTEKAFLENIKKKSIAYEYIERYRKLLKSGVN